MIIQLRGGGVANKGAELMTAAVAAHFASRPEVQLATDGRFGPFAARGRYGLALVAPIRRLGRSKIGYRLLAPRFRELAGLVEESQVDALLDISGFSLGDQRGVAIARAMAEAVREARGCGKRVVLLPQALGPFENPVIRGHLQEIVQCSDRVYARDAVSLAHVKAAAGDQPALRQAPDFTALLKPASVAPQADLVYIVPNVRMQSAAVPSSQQGDYLPFLAECVRQLGARGKHPAILLHSEEDRRLAAELHAVLGSPIDVHEAADPLTLKGMLGSAALVIGSRYHALINALSQGVPAIAFGWSHKYDELFTEYGCPEMQIRWPFQVEDLAASLERALGPDRAALHSMLLQHGGKVAAAARDMWADVDAVLRI
jgi:colanic acid/amylovoran biosynthesis protein